MNNDSLLAGLIASGLTVGITKLFEYLQRREDYKLNQKMKFFERKLQVGEEVLASANSRIHQIDKALTFFKSIKALNEKQEIDVSGYKSFEILTEIFIEDIEMSSIFYFEVPSNLYLYFDKSKMNLPSSLKKMESGVSVAKEWEAMQEIRDIIKSANPEIRSIDDITSENAIEVWEKVIKPLYKYDSAIHKTMMHLFELRKNWRALSDFIERDLSRFDG